MSDDYLQRRLDELYASCEADPASVGLLYLEASFRRLARSSEAMRRATDALARKLERDARRGDGEPGDGDAPDDGSTA